MARQGRVRSTMKIYHILLRGVDMLFDSAEDYNEFYEILKKYTQDGNLKVLSYVFLHNRIHLVVKAEDDEVGRALKPICTSYARYFNRVHATDGKLFYDRFKSEPVNSAEELKEVIAFLNMTAEYEDAKFCSSGAGGREICDHSSEGITDEEFVSRKISSIYIEDFDCFSKKALGDYIYFLCGVRPEEFKALTAKQQQETIEKLTAKRWISKSKIYEILDMKKPQSVKVKKKAEDKKKEIQKEEPKQNSARELSVWLL